MIMCVRLTDRRVMSSLHYIYSRPACQGCHAGAWTQRLIYLQGERGTWLTLKASFTLTADPQCRKERECFSSGAEGSSSPDMIQFRHFIKRGKAKWQRPSTTSGRPQDVERALINGEELGGG